MAPSKTDITRMNKGSLEEALKELGLSHVGSRPELKQRLVDFHYGEKKNNDPMEVVKCPPAVVKPQDGVKAPSKSAIKAMKKQVLQDKLREFGLGVDGDKSQLTARLENYYRPTKPTLPAVVPPNPDKNDAGNDDVKKFIENPSKTQIEAMSETELIKFLKSANLPTEGCMIELIQRLEKHYRPCQDVDIPVEVPQQKKKYSATVTMSVIIHLGQTIGIDIETMEVFEKKEERWYETGLLWNMETNTYVSQ